MIRRSLAPLVLAVTVFGCAFATTAAASPITTAFTAGLEGWTTNDSMPLVHMASGGNPGGFLFLDNCECTIATLFAPSAYLGDLSAYIGGTFSFDVFFDGKQYASVPLRVLVVEAGEEAAA